MARATGLPDLSDPYRPIYRKGEAVMVLDQLALPRRAAYRRVTSAEGMAEAIKNMVLRGAPLIGCAAAYGYALAARRAARPTAALLRRLDRAAALLLASRPTAVNLRHGIERMRAKTAALLEAGGTGLGAALMREADAVAAEDIESNARMAAHGAPLLPSNARVMTICNAGALATAGIGTALGVVRWAHKTRGVERVFVCETRPYLQGSRLTMWELLQYEIASFLITDNMAAHIMKTEKIDAVIAGADRVAANGDAANKIGTYGLAILAKAHGIPLYIVAPSTTVDLSIAHGGLIPIEERSSEEVTMLAGRRIAPEGARARHPAFDVTPARLIEAIVTEKGVIRPVNRRSLRRVLGSA